MPIKTRDFSNVNLDDLQAPAKVFTPDGNAVIANLPKNVQRTAGFLTYGGSNPKEVPIDDIIAMLRVPQNDDNMERAYRNRIKGRLSAIRAFCVLKEGGPRAARMCSSVTCPLWPYRMGTNPFRRKK
jgi:hypothetical protein